MKGVIIDAIRKTVIRATNDATWFSVQAEAGLEVGAIHLPIAEYPDVEVVSLLTAASKVLGVTHEKLCDMFGDVWMQDHATKLYRPDIARNKTACDCIMDLSNIHAKATRLNPNARPPVFEFRWRTDYTLEVTYTSTRGLITLAHGLARAVGRYYREELTILPVSATMFLIKFAVKQRRAT